MAVFNPFYNEETGHTPLDELAPWQQALMNPGARNPGMSMPTFDQNNPYYQFTQSGPLQPGALPAGYDPYAISNGIAGVYNGSNLTGSNQGAGTGTNAGPMIDPATTFNNAKRTTTPPPGNTANRTNTPTPTIAAPALLANNMGMTGAQNVGGVGMYTGPNGPLNTQLFNQQAGNMTPQFDYVRGIDQVSYYKYVLPLQQAGLIDISNPQQVQAAIQQGLARDGGGQWAHGSNVRNVQASPYANFLSSGDPRAQMLNQFMLSGNANAISAAQDWLSKNIVNGSAKTQLDNIDSWVSRFNNYYFPNQQFNPNAITPGSTTGGGQQSPPPGNQQTPLNNNWYQEYQSTNPAQYTQYNKYLDDWAISQLTPSQRNALTGKSDEASLNSLRQALDQIRMQGGYGTWAGINTAATGNKALAGWLSEGYENAPFEPGTDPGQYFKWDWADPDGAGSQVANWFLKMNDPKTYQDVQAAAQYYNTNLKGKGRITGNPYLLSQGDNFAPIAESLFGLTGNQAWQQYNKQVNDYVGQYLDPNIAQTDFTNNNQAIAWLTEMDNIRKQLGYFTNAGMAQTGGQPSKLPLTAYGSSPAGTPFRPNINPLEGFQWSWMDQDGQGAAPGTWGQTMIGTPSTLEQATKMAQAMSQNSNILFGGANLGNIFTSTPNASGGYTFSPNASYFQPKQSSTPSSGFDFSTLFGSNYGGGQQQTPVSYGYNTTPNYATTSAQTTASQTTKPTTPFGGVTNRKSNFANNYSYWG